MATTTPEQVRKGLLVVTAAAAEDARLVADAAEQTPSGVRAALFAAAPLIVADYADAAASLAADWYEELREAEALRRPFSAQPVVKVPDEQIAAVVAQATSLLHDLERETKILTEQFERDFEKSMANLDSQLQPLVASGFRDTITDNVTADPEGVGWRRYARAGGCKFCLMLADRGAVYTESTADFAAHWNCHCTAGPSWDSDAPRADALQYVATDRNRTAADRARIRAYINGRYPDAHG